MPMFWLIFEEYYHEEVCQDGGIEANDPVHAMALASLVLGRQPRQALYMREGCSPKFMLKLPGSPAESEQV
jgi:hypothetical protein